MGKKNRKSDGQRDPELRAARRQLDHRLAEARLKGPVPEGELLTQEDLRKKGVRREPRDFRDLPGVRKVEIVDMPGKRSPRERIEEKRSQQDELGSGVTAGLPRHLPDTDDILSPNPPGIRVPRGGNGLSFLKVWMLGPVIIMVMIIAFFFIGCTERRTTIIRAGEADSCGAACLTSSECDEIVIRELRHLGRKHDEEICNLLAAVHYCLQIKQPKKAVECAQMVIDEAVLKRLDP